MPTNQTEPKRRMQNVSFTSVAECVAWIPPEERAIVDVLRELIFESVDGVKEKLSFNVPFYHRKRMICYVWPGSVQWGAKRYPGVEFGFNRGPQLHDPSGFLVRGSRKLIFNHRFLSVQEIDKRVIRDLLAQAVRIDDEARPSVFAARRRKK